jgi:hypothetical protein
VPTVLTSSTVRPGCRVPDIVSALGWGGLQSRRFDWRRYWFSRASRDVADGYFGG